ncbi:hypothetical protein Nepgr_022025 [Nepenthes gracilis]|uniref:Uncharacterized protein n=1 Tax=Nepenthes gracilis TaxID=150966 RepID=A0AAD3SZS8_NEPGR|nr:hypothetical protein Nepgr_022025 [Nepenthes gracilis]
MAALLSTSTLPTITASTRLALNFSRCGTAGKSSTTTLGLFAERSLAGLNENTAKENPFLCLSVKVQAKIGTEDEIHAKIQRRSGGNLVLSEGRDGDDSYGSICPGCGVYMQSEDPNLPGYYKKRKAVLSDDFEEDDYVEGTLVDDFDGDPIEGDFEVSDEAEGHLKVEDNIDSFDWDSEEWEGELNDEEKDLKELDGFAPAGVGYGNITWDTLKGGREEKGVQSREEEVG